MSPRSNSANRELFAAYTSFIEAPPKLIETILLLAQGKFGGFAVSCFSVRRIGS